MRIESPHMHPNGSGSALASLNRRNFLSLTAFGAITAFVAPAIAHADPAGTTLRLGTPPVTYLIPATDPPFPTQVGDAEQAAGVVLDMVRAALKQRTFAVGGLLVETTTGRVIQALHNNVIRQLPHETDSSFTWDPTAHGERQLVSWYYANAGRLSLPPPEQLSVVTSLDPCAQCAGSLMTAGFNVGVIAFDDVAGVNYTLDAEFTGLPERFRPLAKQTFGYYAITDERAHTGSVAPIYSDLPVSQATAAGCLDVFIESRGVVENVRKSTNLDPSKMIDPATLPNSSPVRQTLTTLFPQAFTMRLADYRRPDDALRRLLEDLVSAQPLAVNAVALIDPFGNLVAAAPDTFDVSPINTGFMNVVEGYSQARFELAANPATKDAGARSLTNPKYGTFVWLHAPSPDQTTTIKDLGIYDLTIEGDIPVTSPSQFQYYLPPTTGTEAELREMIQIMAPWTDPADPQPVG